MMHAFGSDASPHNFKTERVLGACKSSMERISLMDALTQRVTLIRTEAERLRLQGNRESITASAQWFRGV